MIYRATETAQLHTLINMIDEAPKLADREAAPQLSVSRTEVRLAA
jgi:hypothetical protein